MRERFNGLEETSLSCRMASFLCTRITCFDGLVFVEEEKICLGVKVKFMVGRKFEDDDAKVDGGDDIEVGDVKVGAFVFTVLLFIRQFVSFLVVLSLVGVVVIFSLIPFLPIIEIFVYLMMGSSSLSSEFESSSDS